MRLITTALIGTCAMFAVERVGVGQLTTRQQAPTDKAVIFTLADIDAESKLIQARSSATIRLLEGGEAFSVNVLHRSGVEPATVHANLADFYVVREGSAMLETGGALVDPKPAARPGDLNGSSIRGGQTQTVKAGDVVFIPPGVAHRVIESNVTYLNIHFQTKR